jgi:hypothetical protein
VKYRKLLVTFIVTSIVFFAAVYYFHTGYLTAALLSPGVFYFLYFFNPRGLTMFFKTRTITNMSLIFILCLCLPTAKNIFHISGNPHLQEKRKLAQKNGIRFDSLAEYLRRYTDYYNDNFAFRDFLTYTGNLLKLKLFGVSPVPKVIVGKEGWLFQARKNKDPGDAGYFPSIQPFTTSELEEWRKKLGQRHQWLARRGIYYLLIPVPDKSTIYPEFLPDSLRPFYRDSRLDQLVDYLEKHSTIPVLDLRKALLAAKKESVIYYKTDSHWNEYGACIAYGEIIKHLASVLETKIKIKTAGKIQPMPVSDLRIRIKKREQSGGNLAIMLALQDTVFREKRIKLRHRTPYRARNVPVPGNYNLPSVKPAVRERPDADFPKTVMFHDSFARKLKPFLSRHFSRIVYLRDWGFHFHAFIIEAETPKIVLDEVAEHFLYNVQLSNPGELGET